MNFLADFPDENILLQHSDFHVVNVNTHIHTPYSFSAFTNVGQAFEMAIAEHVRVLGINDFIVTQGFEEFHTQALQTGVFPLFNIEFVGLFLHEQAAGIRVNDPNNPGRTYFCGKGLDFPSNPPENIRKELGALLDASNRQTELMVQKLNDYTKDFDLSLSYQDIKKNLAKTLVRERHIAKAVRLAVFEKYQDEKARKEAFQQLFGGHACTSALTDINALENEIRSRLLKSGGPAFVPEDEQAFWPIDKVKKVIEKMGGIPCYPVLLDDKEGKHTEFESDYNRLKINLKTRNIYCVELIPGRNDPGILRKFVKSLHEDGFVVTFGTEHNTPQLIPLKVGTRGRTSLDEDIKEISYLGACVIAAHQYLRARGKEGYTNLDGTVKTDQLDYFRKLGAGVLNHYYSV